MIKKRFKGGGPFDDSAPIRLMHMGLLTPEGSVDGTMVEALSRIMAGLFFDLLCDRYSDIHSVEGVYGDMGDYHIVGDYHRLLLRYTLQYDMLHEPLPASVWWISGNETLVKVFLDLFMTELGRHIEELMTESGARKEAVRQ